ncbi:unnamed protein product [Hyaloperonospora brassicae]|uniref:RxLR effector candidate protein n=1 Tax=Hyaloperonospora brassicae TaxID=162125 RepID=A0AAV0V311_HYABA|nr:unnamed protein product [Hyaloperonospora brassicae]
MRLHPAVLLLLGAAVSATTDAAVQTGQPTSPSFDNGGGPALRRLQSGHDDGEEERQPPIQVDALKWVETYAGALAAFKAHVPRDIDHIADVSKLAKDMSLAHRQATYNYATSEAGDEQVLNQYFEEHKDTVVSTIKALIGTGEEGLQLIASEMQLDLMRWWKLKELQPNDVFELLKVEDSFSKAKTAKQTMRNFGARSAHGCRGHVLRRSRTAETPERRLIVRLPRRRVLRLCACVCDRPTELWRYAGSIDIPLRRGVGMQEALAAGKRLEFVPIDVVFRSQFVNRARTIMSLALSMHSSKKTPVVEHCSPLEKPSSEGVSDKSPYDFVRGMHMSPALKESNFGDLQEVPSTKHIVMFEREHVQKI